MRMGIVKFEHSYIVDLSNREMLDAAVSAIFDDIQNMIMHSPEDFDLYINEQEHEGLMPSDIPTWLKEDAD